MMNEEDLKKILNNPNISDEQKTTIIEALKSNNGNSKKTIGDVNKSDNSNAFVKNEINKSNVHVTRPKLDNTYLFKKIPCSNDIFKIYYLASKNTILSKNSNLLGAFLIKWINEGKILYKYKSKTLFKKECHIIELDKNLRFEETYENEIYSIIRRAAKDNILTDKEFRDFCVKKQFEIQNLLDEICDQEEKKLVEKKLINKKVDVIKEKMQDDKNLLNTEGITITTTNIDISFTKELEDDIRDIFGYKNYIKSLINTQTTLSTDNYVITELLGITNFVSLSFNELFPNFYFRHLQFLHQIRTSFPHPETMKEKIINISKMEMK